MGRLDGKIALITGTSTGIGREAAVLFAKEGATVVGCARNPENATETEALVRAAGGEMHSTAPLDMTDPDAVAGWIAGAVERFGRIDVLYNNAGQAIFGSPAEMTVEEWRACILQEVDLHFFAVRAAWPHLLEHPGASVVMTGSISGIVGVADLPAAAHATAKHGLIGLTRQLAAEGAAHGVRVNSVSPGLIESPATAATIADGAAGPLGPLLAHLPMGRPGRPVEVAQAALFLATDEASYVTGANLVVDGGASVIL
jgi:meso-butanediol dehydrogenase/(S,S)-butanediol dehydrogenase/diacetyl reductase